MSERLTNSVNAVGDIYHREVYSRVAATTGRLTDYKFPLTDIAILPLVYAPELFLGTYLYSFLNTPVTEDSVIGLAKGVSVQMGVFMLAYGGNYLRTPIDKKMGLQPNKEMDSEEELSFVINRLNGLKDVQSIDLEELPKLTYNAVDVFLQKNQGYSIDTSRRVKFSRFSNLMMWKHGAGGLMNPFLQEIVMFSRLHPEAFAHEQAHLQGVPQERLAEFIGIAAQVESPHPYINFLGYKHWLNRLVAYKNEEWSVKAEDPRFRASEIAMENLLERGLDYSVLNSFREDRGLLDKVLDERRSYSKYTVKVVDKALEILPDNIRNLLPGGLINALRDPELTMTSGMRWMILRLTGQRDVRKAYVEQPLQLLSSYRKMVYDSKEQ